MLEQLIEYDKALFLFLNNLGTPTWDGFWIAYTTKFNWIPLYGLLLYLVYKKTNSKLFFLTVAVIALMVLFMDQTTNFFKHVLVKRLRPCHDIDVKDLMRLVKAHCGGMHGYFSGHASNSMCVAVFVGLVLRYKYKYLIGILLFWSLVMAYSRIYVGVHYPLDIVSGLIFGAITGFLFYKLDVYLQARYNKKIN